MKSSGIGGQAVIEGIMMRNKDKYSIAVRKPDNDIEVTVRDCKVLTEKYKWMGYPIIRGVVSFIDSLVTGISTINYSASFYDDPEEQKKTKADEIGKSLFKDKFESVLMAFTVILSVFMAVGLFMLLPYFVSRLVKGYVASKTLLNFIEGLVRVAIFILYLLVISLMKDIKRTFMYHGAEHKCINCIENGARLTTENVMNSSRYHKRCGTSFLFIVMFISVVFFIFIRVDNTALQIVIRLLLVPVIAGVSYEFIRWAGKNDNGFTMVLSKPGMWLQKLTTREPDEDMVEVAIKAVEEVFDWKAFLEEYYAHSPNPEADMLASEAKLAMDGELLHKGKNTRKIDAQKVAHETAIAETIRAVEQKSASNADSTVKSSSEVKTDVNVDVVNAAKEEAKKTEAKADEAGADKDNAESAGAKADEIVKDDKADGSTSSDKEPKKSGKSRKKSGRSRKKSGKSGSENKADIVNEATEGTEKPDDKVDVDVSSSDGKEPESSETQDSGGSLDEEKKSAGADLDSNEEAEKALKSDDEGSVKSDDESLNKSDIESPDTEDDDDELPEGFEIEDEYETVHIEEKAAGGEFAVTSESVAEPEISDDYTVEEVEAGFEIEEMETEDENLDISADDVPLFKERDRH
uniref:DUF1385 domain-containing protein n=1 Tax=Lachnospira sp. TaxID=2049031 RepID=UPI003FF0EE6E